MSAFTAIKKNEAGAETAKADGAKNKGKGGMPPALAAALGKMEKAKTDGDAEAMAAAAAEVEKAFSDVEFVDSMPENKAAGDAPTVEKADVVKNVAGVLGDMGRVTMAIAKGQVVTTEKADAFFAGLEKMADAAFEMDPVAFGAFIEKAMKLLPSNATVRSGVRPTGAGPAPGTPPMHSESPVKKAEEDAPPTWFAELKKSVDGIGTRVEAIEKAHPAPANANPDGGSQTTEVKKSAPGLWAGLPI